MQTQSAQQGITIGISDAVGLGEDEVYGHAQIHLRLKFVFVIALEASGVVLDEPGRKCTSLRAYSSGIKVATTNVSPLCIKWVGEELGVKGYVWQVVLVFH